MAIVLSHTTAAAILASPLSQQGEPLPCALSSLKAIATPASADLAAIEMLKSQLAHPIHLLVPPGSHWKRTRTVAPHEFTGALGTGALWRLTDTVLVCGPSLNFIQMGTILPELDHLLYGYQLCGSHAVADVPGGVVQREPLVTVSDLASCIEHHPGLRGSRIARGRVQHIRDGAASPMESALALRLLLPRKKDGLGISSLVLNHGIEIPASMQQAARCRHFYLDAFIPEASVGTEYDSDAFHTAPEKIARDAVRRNILESLGIRMITITRKQLIDAEEFQSVAASIDALLGRRRIAPSAASIQRSYDFTAALRGALARMKPAVPLGMTIP